MCICRFDLFIPSFIPFEFNTKEFIFNLFYKRFVVVGAAIQYLLAVVWFWYDFGGCSDRIYKEGIHHHPVKSKTK